MTTTPKLMPSVFAFEQTPPVSVPYRFFVTAPLFAAAAGLGLAWLGADAFQSRWAPGLLAVVHLFTLGFLLQATGGALLQILPVAAGASVWRPGAVAAFTHVGLSLGAVLLAGAFASGSPLLFRIAAHLLGLVVAGYCGVVGWSILKTGARGGSVLALRLAVPALLSTVVLGILLAGVFGGQWSLPVMELAHLHAAWGLLGWGGALVIGVAYLVVPMFQLTPPYRPARSVALLLALAGLLLAWSLAVLAGGAALRTILALALGLPVAAFAGWTLVLQAGRRRRQPDVTLLFWRFGMVALLAAVAVLSLDLLLPETDERLEILAGVLLLPGVFLSLISGMLYKIVPFLNWLHLQRVVAPAPNMKHMLAESAMMGQFRVHLAAVAVASAAVFLPVLVVPAGLLLAASALYLEWNLLGAVRIYRRLHAGEPAEQVLGRRPTRAGV